jgi:two-component system response regulator MprA
MVEPPSSHGDDRDADPARILLSPFRLGDLTIDPTLLTVEIGGRRHLLTATEWRLLTIFLARPEQVLAYDEVAQWTWGEGHHGSALMVYISRLRMKLERYRGVQPQLIQTVRERGYRLAETPVRIVEHPPEP